MRTTRMRLKICTWLLLAVALLTECSLSLSLPPEDEFIFDDEQPSSSSSSNEPVETQANYADRHQSKLQHQTVKESQRVDRLLGLPDAVATVGHVFKIHVPDQAFAGDVDYYKARRPNGEGLPHWLRWDEPASALYGVPSHKDVGRHRIVIKAVGKHGDSAEDSFTIHVVPRKNRHFSHRDKKKQCSEDQDRTVFSLLIDAKFDSLKPKAKVNALENLEGFLGLAPGSASIVPEPESGPGSRESAKSFIVLNVGDVKRRKKHSSIIQWQVGCNGQFWPGELEQLKQIPDQTRDGSLSEVTMLPVLGWRVRSEPNEIPRTRREVMMQGSGDGAGGGGGVTQQPPQPQPPKQHPTSSSAPRIPIQPKPQMPPVRPPAPELDETEEHPHRHHHGEESIAGIGAGGLDNGEEFIWKNSDANNEIFNSSSPSTSSPSYSESSGPAKETPMTEPTWIEHNITDKINGENLDPYDSINVPVSSMTTTSTTESPTTTSTTTQSTTTSTTPEPTTASTSPSTTTSTTTVPTTSTSTTPEVERRLKKIPVTEGKLLSYTIPEDTFRDHEDGDTRHLRLKVYERGGAPLKSSDWLQFNEATHEVYGLPLQIGNQQFEVVASDSRGLSTSERLDIIVQQHKQFRAFNHEFTIRLKIEKRNAFPSNVDWELKVMRNLAQLYGDTDLSYITVRFIDIDVDNDQATFSWTNDTLARSDICPYEEIMKLHRVLIANEKSEDPSDALIEVLGPEIRPKRVLYEGHEQCQQMKETQTNHHPVTRNQIDQLNATVGQLFIYKVPEDTFWDEEDGDTGKLRASLLTADREEILASNWLQFDSKNQQFYGVPLTEDIGRKTYQLVVKDREGWEATDSLVAEVYPAASTRHPMEVRMMLSMPYDSFARSARKRRELVEKLQRVFGDYNARSISLISVSGGTDSVTVSWRNTSLPTHTCPSDEIARIERFLMNDKKDFTNEILREFGNQGEWTVLQATVVPMGACQDSKPDGKMGSPTRGSMGVGMGIPPEFPYGGGSPPARPPLDDNSSLGASRDEYLVTYVLPGIIIAAMMTLASLIACILYKKRRSGKMSISEKDDERKSFRNKGIPVIFQDELEEKPEPGNKSPMILKQEKPPLPPPEYHQSRLEDGADIPMLSHDNSEEPYQRPPPFTTAHDNNRHNRPKPTPTYRKPPPYVPP
ncbi:hypothetical protein QAD02_005469 [Eretmocerus hayati]|uniref:Uncharacterized protein n=1 Tax=Eretmocerus hayati TaxID=131215 RepID=A0ACC2NSZ8_9HYME|nr:hypothetical protein QAD02_005469 [Eretmocerus hayati]